MSEENYIEGYNRGVKDTIQEIVNIVNMSDYPEDLEDYLYDYLIEKGVKI